MLIIASSDYTTSNIISLISALASFITYITRLFLSITFTTYKQLKITIRYEISINTKWMVDTKHSTVRFEIFNIRILHIP